ncbi:lipase family protein [Agromyces soli]
MTAEAAETQLAGAVVSFPVLGHDGSSHEQTGLVHRPSSPPPPGGYPVVVYGHMTTGGSPRSAPSGGSPGHPEWRRMSQGDALCRRLLDRGIAVLRPDYEGIGGPGVHPYLIGSSLAASMTSMMRARATFEGALGTGAALGDDWVAAGHSEGALAALHASVADEPDARSRLRGTAAFAPPTRMDLSIGAMRRVGARFPGSGIVSALTALMLRGAATGDERLRELLADGGGGLSDAATARWSQLDERCLTELADADSWGAIAPGRIGGARAGELFERLDASFRANEVAALRGFRAPVRIDAARFDEVAPAPLAAALMRGYRAAGVELTSDWWPTHHSGTMHPQHAPSRAAEWIAARFR